MSLGEHLVAVYDDPGKAAWAVAHLREEMSASDIAVDDPCDTNSAVLGEQEDESDHMVALITRDMAHGIAITVPLAGLLGMLAAIPLLWLRLDSWTPLSWALLVMIVGFAMGSAIGSVIGGARGATRSMEEAMSPSDTVIRTGQIDPGVLRTLLAADPVRVDLVDDHGLPIDVLATRIHGLERPGPRHRANDLLIPLQPPRQI